MIKRAFHLAIILFITGHVLLLTVWPGNQRQVQAAGFPAAVIAATEVKQEQWLPRLSAVGSLVATHGIRVSSEVNGIVSSIAFQSGGFVEKGQELIRLDVEVDEAELKALKADRRLAEVQYNRSRDLFSKKALSKSQLDEAKARFDAADARVYGQQAIINRKIIRAPFSGRLGIRQIDLGEYLEAGNPIVSLQALDPVHVDFSLPERYINSLQAGQTVLLKLDALPGEQFKGEISAIDSGVDTGTRTLKVRATLPNKESKMRPGMFAQVEVITGEPQTVLTLPRTAISFNTYGNFVFVINDTDQGKTVKRTAVEIGEVRDGRVVVNNLSAGTQVVRTGLVKLRDGAPVKIDNQVKLNDQEITKE